MSNYLRIFIPLPVLILLISACSNDLEVNMPNNSIPVVYGVIDPWADSYMLFISKSVQAETNIYQSVGQPEAFTPDSVQVRMELWNDSVMLWYTYFHQVETVVGPGLFPKGSGLAMKSDRVIPRTGEGDMVDIVFPDFRNLRFFITSPDFQTPAYARVEYSGPFPIIKPSFIDQHVKLYGTEPFVVTWGTNKHLTYFDLYFNIRYSEFSDTTRNSSILFCYTKNIKTITDEYKVIIDPAKFLNAFASGLAMDTLPCIRRRILDFDIIVAGGDDNFDNYVDQARFDSPVYQKPWTNITNGLGVIALNYDSKKVGFRFSQESLDSLALGRYTERFRFVRW